MRIAINGFGRIGRNILRAWSERDDMNDCNIIAINDLGDRCVNAHLLKYDSVHGTFDKNVDTTDSGITVDGYDIRCFTERSPGALPWAELAIDVVLECTGRFTDAAEATKHIQAGAKKVLISALGKNVDATVVYGLNHQSLTAQQSIVSNASCTTNCLSPLADVLNRAVGIEQGLVTTIHAYTNDQSLSDAYHDDIMRARAATQSLIPTKTGAVSAVSLVLPELQGKIDGLAIRVPVINVSLLDFCFAASRKTNVDEINFILTQAAQDMPGIIAVNSLPMVSIDFNHNPASSIVDLTQTRVIDNQVKVLAWYDNEWGFSNRMLDTATVLAQFCADEANQGMQNKRKPHSSEAGL